MEAKETKAIYDYYGAEKFWGGLTETEQIQAAVVVFRKLVDHARTESSFRHMLYNEFGWSANAYSAIYAAGGMAIHNMLYEAAENEKQEV